MLNFRSSMLCTSKIRPFSLGNHLGTSLVIGNLVIIRVTNVEWTWLGLEWPPIQYVALYKGDIVSPLSCALSCILAISNSISNTLHFNFLESPIQSCSTPNQSCSTLASRFMWQMFHLLSIAYNFYIIFILVVGDQICKHFNLLPSSINYDYRIHSFSTPYMKIQQGLCY